MRLPEPIERLLEPGRERLREPPRFAWRRLFPGGRSQGGTIELNYDFDLPPWNAGPYREDVPK